MEATTLTTIRRHLEPLFLASLETGVATYSTKRKQMIVYNISDCLVRDLEALTGKQKAGTGNRLVSTLTVS
jgi:hypothetical protein